MAGANNLALLLADFGDRTSSLPFRGKPAAAATDVAVPVATQKPPEPATPPLAAEARLSPPDAPLRDRVAALETELAAARDEYAAAIERLAAIHRVEIAGRIEAGIAAIGERLSESVDTALARALAPLMTAALAKKSAAAFAARLGDLARPGAAIRLRFKGSRVLFDEVSAQLSACDWAVEFAEADGTDLTAEFDQTVIETRIGEWVRLIEVDPEW